MSNYPYFHQVELHGLHKYYHNPVMLLLWKQNFESCVRVVLSYYTISILWLVIGHFRQLMSILIVSITVKLQSCIVSSPTEMIRVFTYKVLLFFCAHGSLLENYVPSLLFTLIFSGFTISSMKLSAFIKEQMVSNKIQILLKSINDYNSITKFEASC